MKRSVRPLLNSLFASAITTMGDKEESAVRKYSVVYREKNGLTVYGTVEAVNKSVAYRKANEKAEEKGMTVVEVLGE